MAGTGAAGRRGCTLSATRGRNRYYPVVAHNSYLINLAAAAADIAGPVDRRAPRRVDRAEALGLDGLVMHPGSYTTGTEQEGLRLIGDAIGSLLAERPRARTMILLEHTAGQGTNLGHRFEHLASSSIG